MKTHHSKTNPPPAAVPGNITVTFSCDRRLNDWLETKCRDRQLPKGALVRLFLIERRSLDVTTAHAPRESAAAPAIITVAAAKRRAGKGGAR